MEMEKAVHSIFQCHMVVSEWSFLWTESSLEGLIHLACPQNLELILTHAAIETFFVPTIPYGSLETPAWWENEKCCHPQLHSLSTERSGWARPPDHVSPSVIYPEALLVASSPVWLLLIGLTTFCSFFLQHLCNKSYNLETIRSLWAL